MKWETIAALIGAFGGLSGFASLGYTVVGDRRRNAEEVASRIKTHMHTDDVGRRYLVEYDAPKTAERYKVIVKSRPGGALTFARVAEWKTNRFGSQTPVRADEEATIFRGDMKRASNSHNALAEFFISKRGGNGSSPRIEIVIAIAQTDRVVARAIRHIND